MSGELRVRGMWGFFYREQLQVLLCLLQVGNQHCQSAVTKCHWLQNHALFPTTEKSNHLLNWTLLPDYGCLAHGVCWLFNICPWWALSILAELSAAAQVELQVGRNSGSPSFGVWQLFIPRARVTAGSYPDLGQAALKNKCSEPCKFSCWRFRALSQHCRVYLCRKGGYYACVIFPSIFDNACRK